MPQIFLRLEIYAPESRRGVRVGNLGVRILEGGLPGGMWPLKVSCYLYIQPVTKLSFSWVFLRALARRLNFEMTVFSGVFQKYHSVDRLQENVGFI